MPPRSFHHVKSLANVVLGRGGQTLIRTPYYPCELVYKSIPGWFSDDDVFGLWFASALQIGSCLEIGHYLGRSTSVICQRIQQLGPLKRFVSYDLPIRDEASFHAHFKTIDENTTYELPAELAEIYKSGRCVTDVARENLQRYKLDQFVELIAGDFRDEKDQFDFIFCDAAHGPHETNENIPHCHRLLAKHGLLAVHDVTPALLPIYSNLGFNVVMIIGTVGLFRRIESA